MITWTCHVCGKERPDSAMSVFSKDTSLEYNLPPGTMKQNLRYCNDNQDCINGAPNHSFLKNRGDVMEVKHTDRGFEYIDFKDFYGEECSLQQSSIALNDKPGTSAIWFGAERDRMHLNREQLEELMVHLNNWLEHGTFKL